MATPNQPIELLDSEVDRIQAVWDLLRKKHQKSYRNYADVEDEIKGRFADIGFVVVVNWFKYTIDGKPGEGASPEVTIVGRCDPKHQFDHDQQVREVTSNILGLPDQEGVIRTDDGQAFKKFREGGGDHGHHH